MAAKNKTIYTPKKYESIGTTFIDKNGTKRKDTYASIYESMLLSKAFKNLSKNQKLLYVYCKAQITGKRKPRQDYKDVDSFDKDEMFYLSLQMVIDYGLYKKGGQTQFRKDMKALQEKGFIKKEASGRKNKSKNIYKLVDEWQKNL